MNFNSTYSSLYSAITPGVTNFPLNTSITSNTFSGNKPESMANAGIMAQKLYLLGHFHISLTNSFLPIGISNLL